MDQNKTTRRTMLAGALGLGAALTVAGQAEAAPSQRGCERGRGKGLRKHGHCAAPEATTPAVPTSKPVSEPKPWRRELVAPLQMAYFRTWHDKATDPTRPNCIADIPAEVDVVFVFADYTPPESGFWVKLKDEYVPTLHSRGTRVVRTIGVRDVLDPKFPDTPEGWKANAESIVKTYVDEHGLDGIDVDVEQSFNAQDSKRVAGVFRELSKLVGPRSGTGRLFIYDTNRTGDDDWFQASADCFDFVLVQSYGRRMAGLQETWNTFAPHIKPEQYLIGFSFYEERGTNWGDTTEPWEQSRAAKFADWQPKGQVKGGIFSYAVDRDGIAIGDDQISLTSYEWSKRLKQRMLANV